MGGRIRSRLESTWPVSASKMVDQHGQAESGADLLGDIDQPRCCAGIAGSHLGQGSGGEGDEGGATSRHR